jgi:hypothetical protein
MTLILPRVNNSHVVEWYDGRQCHINIHVYIMYVCTECFVKRMFTLVRCSKIFLWLFHECAGCGCVYPCMSVQGVRMEEAAGWTVSPTWKCSNDCCRKAKSGK